MCVNGEYDLYEQELNARWRALWQWADPHGTLGDSTLSSSSSNGGSGSGSGSGPHDSRALALDTVPLMSADTDKQQA